MSALPPLLLVAACAATGAAVYTIAVSRIAPHPFAQSVLAALVCFSFVGAGIVGLRRRPYGRFGLLLAAAGFASLLSVLHEANSPVPYTIGVFSANLVFAVLLHALLSFPTGRIGSRGGRALVVLAYLDVVVVQAVAVVFDPLTRYQSDHPANAALLSSRSSLATGLLELEAALAIAVVLAAGVILARRARAATEAARRRLLPVLWFGWCGLLVFAVALAVVPLSAQAGVIGFTLALLASLALPYAFLGIVLGGRLGRVAVGQLLVALRETPDEVDLRAALQRALDDPDLDLLVWDRGSYVGDDGGPATLPEAGDPRTATPIEHQGMPVGMLVHDSSLRLRPELLDEVGAAAGFALANERARQTVQRVEARDRALLDAIPDLILRVARDGTYLEVRAADPSGLVAPPEELAGRNVREVLPRDVVDDVLGCVERTLETSSMSSIEYELEIAGVRRWRESRIVPSGDAEVTMIVRDVTEQRRLGDEQAALRRVATLVASDPPPEQVFQTVTEEVCRLLGLRTVGLYRFEGERSATMVGAFGDTAHMNDLGNRIELDEGAAAFGVLRTGAPARSDIDMLSGARAAGLRALGFRAAVGVPISVGGVTWGALIAALREGESMPGETERRLQAFAELVALAVASAHTREELAASRRRIVDASDAERRRIERNLHDGAQQRLVALSVGLRLAQRTIREDPDGAEALIEVASTEMTEALAELRELARGIHPAVLTERGLEAALELLAARAPFPVIVDVRLAERPPEPVEAAGYYVVSEALTNAAKHARATTVGVRIEQLADCMVIEVTDDGAGGADPGRGSGLGGLRDRVETLDGALEIESPQGRGTLVRATLPVRSRALEGAQIRRA